MHCVPGRFLICDGVSVRFIEFQRNAGRRLLLIGSDSSENKGTLCLQRTCFGYYEVL